MNANLSTYIYSKRVYAVSEFDLADYEAVWEDRCGVVVGLYSNDHYHLLEKTIDGITVHKPFGIEEVEARLKIGHLLFMATRGDAIIGFSWIATNVIEVPYFHATIHLNQDEAITYNVYVVEEYRGRRVNESLQGYAFHYLKNRGYRRVLCYIHSDNKSSARSFSRLGFKTIGELVYVILLGFEFRWHNLESAKIVFNGGAFRLWKALCGKVRERFRERALV